MNKKELIKAIADQSGLSLTDAAKAVGAFIDTVTDTLNQGDEVNLVGFLKLTRRRRDARTGRNPKTGEQIQIPAAWVVKVAVGKLLKDRVNGA